ncbi:30S ribosomal protein S21 [Patescibacteria group bacterium]
MLDSKHALHYSKKKYVALHFQKDTDGGCIVAGIRVREGESFEAALRRFNKAVDMSGILKAAQRASRYKKPSDKRRQDVRMSLLRIRKEARRRGEYDT